MKRKKVFWCLLPLLCAFIASCNKGDVSTSGTSSGTLTTPADSSVLDTSITTSDPFSTSNDEPISISDDTSYGPGTSSDYPDTSSNEPDISTDGPDSSSEEPVSTPEDSYLTIPVVSVHSESGVASWTNVSNADYYEYIINGNESQVTTARSIQLQDKQNISVRAHANSSNVRSSDWSAAKSFFVLDDIIIDPQKEVKVYFHDSDVETQVITTGRTVSRPQDPNKQHHQFENWYEDPFFSKEFDFNKVITKQTVIYANWIANDLVANTYYWVKGDEKMTSSIQSKDNDWKLIPLKRNNGQTAYKEYKATVTVSSAASSSQPCRFLIADGLDTLPGRNYWKDKTDSEDIDFEIYSPGTYTIFFSTEHQWENSLKKPIHVYVSKENTPSSLQREDGFEIRRLETPLLDLDYQTNMVSWNAVDDAVSYGYTINNGAVQYTGFPQVALNTKDFISVIAIGDGENYFDSHWSNPVARYNIIVKEDPGKEYCYVYFHGLKEVAQVIRKNNLVARPIDPTLENYVFAGWYTNIARTKAFDFDTPITENLTLYAKWTANDDWKTTDYYYMADLKGNKIAGLRINQSVLTHYEYFVKLSVDKETEFFIKNRENTKTYGSYKLESAGTFTVYFSVDVLWNDNSSETKNIYITGNMRTLYFTNALSWTGDIYAYMWRGSIPKKSWPGDKMTWIKKNSYDQNIYRVSIDLNKYDYVVFNNNSKQTVDILIADVLTNGVYTKNSSADGKKYDYGTFNYTD